MRKKYISISMILFMLLTQGLVFSQQAEDLYERAKLYLFDKEWKLALAQLDKLIRDFPKSKLYSLALFYRAKCHEELKRPEKALDNYTDFLKISKNKSLNEEANIAIIDLSYYLYKKGEKNQINRITSFLKKKNLMVQYYAAFKLSYVKDKKIARIAVPVLKRMIAEEDDPELIDRAKIALMRINPDYLKTIPSKNGYEKSFLKIRVYSKKLKMETISVNILFGLAKLALDALPDESKAILKEKGYNVNNIIKTLTSGMEILKIEDEEHIYKIWIE